MVYRLAIKTIIKMIGVIIKYKIKSRPDVIRAYWNSFMGRYQRAAYFEERANVILRRGRDELDRLRDDFNEEVDKRLVYLTDLK